MPPLLEEKGITLLEPSERRVAERLLRHARTTPRPNGVTALSDLEGQSITLAAAPDCEGRDDCEGGLTEVYGIDIELLPLGYATPQTYKSP